MSYKNLSTGMHTYAYIHIHVGSMSVCTYVRLNLYIYNTARGPRTELVWLVFQVYSDRLGLLGGVGGMSK